MLQVNQKVLNMHGVSTEEHTSNLKEAKQTYFPPGAVNKHSKKNKFIIDKQSIYNITCEPLS